MKTDNGGQHRADGGFTLIEVLVSMMILSVGTVALASLLARASRAATDASANVYQTAALTSEVGRLGAIPFTSLAAGTTCVNVNAGPFLHQRCAVITAVSAKVFRIVVTVTPTGATNLTPISTSFERSISGSASPPLNQ
jgi:prepilin-type N-terminal cleavage/methylation domain-containing protein